MKKSLVALAALAATSAFAQSSVEIYGVLDVAQVKISGHEAGLNNTTNSYPVSQSASGLANGFARQATSTNNIGFRGREDLGGGMYAGFDLQTGGLDLSTGAPALAFSRESNLKLGSSSWGEVKIGRSASTMCSIGCSFDYNYIGAGSAYALQGLSPASNKGSSRRSDQIEWTSPSMGGFVGRIGVVQAGDQNVDGSWGTIAGAAYLASATSPTTGKIGSYKNAYTYGGTYTQGALRIAAAVETAQSDSPALRTAQFVAAEYDFGFVKANIQSFTNSNRSTWTGADNSSNAKTGQTVFGTAAGTTTYGKGNGFSLIAPIGNLKIGAQYAKNTEQGTKATELFARYSLSKRTEIFAYNTAITGASAVTVDSPSAVDTSASAANVSAANQYKLGRGALQADPKITAIGIRHTFYSPR